jgi:methylenetetrahydrofolate dehydrogenase (NADP+)/methenyltetrahydrofolate cyclohydrolase/formyltetrahydrofolate synthetase
MEVIFTMLTRHGRLSLIVGKGALGLAEAVVNACEGTREGQFFKFLYRDEEPLEKKIEIIVKEMYGGSGIILSEMARNKLALYTAQVGKFYR